MIAIYLLSSLMGYLLGSFPTGYIVGRLMGGVDVRTIGSGRTGGTNVYRAAGKSAGLLTVVGDIGKGALAVVLARLLWEGDPAAAALAGLFSILGHNYSIFLGFKGGAGTMTAMGALFALHPVLLLLVSPIPLLFTYVTRMSSVGSLLASALVLLLGSILIWQSYFPLASLIYFAGFFVLSWYSLLPNLERLHAGTERRIGDSTAST